MSEDVDEPEPEPETIISFEDFAAAFGINPAEMMQLANEKRLPFAREADGLHYVRGRDFAEWGAAAYIKQQKDKDAQVETEAST